MLLLPAAKARRVYAATRPACNLLLLCPSRSLEPCCKLARSFSTFLRSLLAFCACESTLNQVLLPIAIGKGVAARQVVEYRS